MTAAIALLVLKQDELSGGSGFARSRIRPGDGGSAGGAQLSPTAREEIRLRGVLIYEHPSDERRKSMTLSRNTWIAIGVLMVVAAIVAIGLVASGGGGAGGAY
jgi:hypothetical protein